MEEGYYENDLKGNFTFFNDAIVKIHGYTAEELMGMNYRRYLHPEQAAKNLKIFSDVYRTGVPAQLENYEIIRKDGSIRMTEVSGYPLRDHNGETIGFWGITRDRTQQKLAEKALQKSEEQYRLLVNNASDAIYITGQGRIAFCNPKTAKITGYTNEELAGLVFVDMVHPEDKGLIHESRHNATAQDSAPDVFSFRIYTKQKELRWVELSAVGITWDGRPATLNFLRDVTHQKSTEERLKQAQKMEAIGTLAGGIAHDFNNILSAILGYAELAMGLCSENQELQNDLSEVLVAGQRAKDLVYQILAFARQSDEGLKPVSVGLIAKEALKLIRSSIPSTIDIRPKIISKSPVMGNPTQIHQIVMNLCTNAAHAMQTSGGVLSVELCDVQLGAQPELGLPAGNYLKLSVADTGCGIAPEIMGAIFDPYFTTKGLGEGTGMGLSVVQGIVEKYGGKITVESQLGKGSTFTIFLPVAKASYPEAPQAALAEMKRHGESILFVDDEAAIAKMGGRILERLGYQVTIRTSSIEALNLFSNKPDAFDLVITDMTMPNMTGEHLAKEMMRIRPDIPIILCTGYSKQINKELALEMGIKAFVFKPIVQKDLAQAIRKVLEAP
jgi:PAS domain S-box-containing protein